MILEPNFNAANNNRVRQGDDVDQIANLIGRNYVPGGAIHANELHPDLYLADNQQQHVYYI